MKTYNNPVMEPFGFHSLNGYTYFLPVHNDLSWVKYGYQHTRNGGSPVGGQRKLSIDEFLANIPALSYAPIGEEPQETLVMYLDTTWLTTEIAKFLGREGDPTDKELVNMQQLVGTVRTLQATKDRLVEIVEEHWAPEVLLKAEDELTLSRPPVSQPFVTPFSDRASVQSASPTTCTICGEEEGAKVHTDTTLHPDDAVDGLHLHAFTPVGSEPVAECIRCTSCNMDISDYEPGVTTCATCDDEVECICCPNCDVDDHRKDCPEWGG